MRSPILPPLGGRVALVRSLLRLGHPDEAAGDKAFRHKLGELEAVFQALTDGVIVIDTAGQVVEVNRALLGQLGVGRREDVLGPLAQLMRARATRPDGSPLSREELAGYRALRNGEVVRAEVQVERSSGGPLLLETVASPIREHRGGTLGVVIISRDVSEERRQQRDAELLAGVGELLSSSDDVEAMVRGVAERCVDELADWCAVYLYDHDAERLGPGALEVRGAGELEALVNTLLRRPFRLGEGFVGEAARSGQPVVLPDLRDAPLRRYIRSARELQLVRQLGPCSIVAVPINGDGGLVGAILLGSIRPARRLGERDGGLAEAIARCASGAIERGRRADELRQILARLEVVLDSMSDGLVVFGGDGHAILANRTVREMLDIQSSPLGWSAEDFARRSVECLEHSDGEGIVDRGTDGSEMTREELRLARPRPMDVERVASPVRGPDGEILGQVVLYRDLSHLRAVERLRNESASSMSRELRMPLTAISAYAAQALRRTRQVGADRAVAHGLEVILRNARQLTVMVGDLLDADRIDLRALELVVAEVDVLVLVEQAVDQGRAMTTLHRLRIDAPVSLPPAWWDPDRARQAITQLLSNAVRYWPEGGQIGVRIRPREEGVVISVRDRGLGIPPDQLERVFERFYRVTDTPARRRIRGSGLGLHRVRGIADAHGGTVWAESTGVAGEGTTVHLLLPWQAGSAGDRP